MPAADRNEPSLLGDRTRSDHAGRQYRDPLVDQSGFSQRNRQFHSAFAENMHDAAPAELNQHILEIDGRQNSAAASAA
jgi:hypothetical protein